MKAIFHGNREGTYEPSTAVLSRRTDRVLVGNLNGNQKKVTYQSARSLESDVLQKGKGMTIQRPHRGKRSLQTHLADEKISGMCSK